jgi:hypothetical protein
MSRSTKTVEQFLRKANVYSKGCTIPGLPMESLYEGLWT